MNDCHLLMLKECCRLRGLSLSLIHRTMREFSWFCSAVIWGENSANEEERRVYKMFNETFRYAGDNTLERWIEIFYEYCKEEYDENKKETTE